MHKNSSLNGVDNFNYLKFLLKETAANVISGLTLTNSNYDHAIELLKNRFGNRQVIITSHMDALTKLQRITAPHDVKALRQLYDTVESHIRGLESLEISDEMYGCFLTPIIMQKLPEEIRIMMSRELSSETWVLKDIMQAFNKELKLREQCTFSKDPKPPQDKPPRNGDRGKQPHSSSALLSDAPPQQSVWCSYCNQAHPSVKCGIITSVEARKQLLRKKGRCFQCLKGGHVARNCKGNSKCLKCHGLHHTSICDKDSRQVNKEGTQSSMNSSSHNNNQVSTSMYVDESRRSILLQTAKANIVRPEDGRNSVTIRLVFDSCSQRSYISQGIKERMKLAVIGRESLLIKTFGEGDAKLRECEVVQVGIKTISSEMVYVCAFVFAVIREPWSKQSIQSVRCNYKNLRDLFLAGDSSRIDELPIQMLVEADYYWSLVDGAVKR